MLSRTLWLLTLASTISLAACSPKNTVPPPQNLNARSTVLGVWDWGDEDACQENTHTISFADGGETLVLTHQYPLMTQEQTERFVYRYQIVESGGNSITGIMEDEDRVTDSGETVVWTLTMFTPNRYHWQRTDWESNRYTRGVVRCSGAAPSSPLESENR